MKKILISIFVFLITASVVFAHQPRIVDNNEIEIKNPEISQAFYGELTGEPHYYSINSSEAFNLYVSLLVPALSGIDKDVSARITGNGFEYFLDASDFEWTSFHEEFANDDYFQGPEMESTKVESGIYNIEVFSPDNAGKYVLVVGEKEEFPPDEIVNTLKLLPELKGDFFEKSPLTAYFNLIGLFIFVPIIILLILIFIGIFIYVKKTKKNRRK